MAAHAAPIKVLVVDDNEKARDGLIELLRFEDVQVVGESTLGTAAYTWAEHLNVDVVLVAVGEPLARALRTVESLAVGARTWPVVALSALGDRETMRKAMVSGARDFVVMPATAQELHRTIVEIHAVEQHRRDAAATGEAANHLGTIVAVFGVKGGIGKSTLATNVGVSLAQQTGQHVAMVDLDLQFGDAAVLLDLLPQRTIADAAKDIERMDPQLITGYLTQHASRLRLLPTPPTPDDADGITGDIVGQVLEALAATNDYVVADLSAQFDQVSMVALDLATIILVPTLPDVSCVRRTRGALTMMQQWGYTKDKVKLVVNRSRRRSEVSLAEIQEVLAYEIYAEIPEDSSVGRANSLGTPIAMSGPNTKAGRAILELGRKLAGLPDPQRRLFGLRRGEPAVEPGLASRLAQPTAAPATSPSLSSWARGHNGAPETPAPQPSMGVAPAVHEWQGAAPDLYDALDRDYWNALFGPREAKNRVWANLIGPVLPFPDGAPPGAAPVPPAAATHHPEGARPAPPAQAATDHLLASPNGSAD